MCEKCVELGKAVQMWAEKVAEAQEQNCGNLIHHLEDSLSVAHIKYIDAVNSCQNIRLIDPPCVEDGPYIYNGVIVTKARYYELVRENNRNEIEKLEGFMTEQEMAKMCFDHLFEKSYEMRETIKGLHLEKYHLQLAGDEEGMKESEFFIKDWEDKLNKSELQMKWLKTLIS